MTVPVKTFVSVLSFAALCALSCVGLAYRDLRLKSEAAERVREEKRPAFQAELSSYKNALPIGTTRFEVIQYLRTRGLAVTENREEVLMRVGEEPDVFPCDRWAVYLSFQFTMVQPKEGSTSIDRLGSISLKKLGHCL